MLGFILLIAFGISAASTAPSSLSLFFESFQDNNEVLSLTPGFDWKWNFEGNWTLTLNSEIDGVSGASRVNPPDIYSVDGISGASRQWVPTVVDGVSGATAYEFRKSGEVHIKYEDQGDIVDVGYYASIENDYSSQAPSLALSSDFFSRNLTVSLNTSYYFDRYTNQNVFFEGKQGSAPKRIFALQGGLTQSLTKYTLISGSVQRMFSWGYLSKPHNPILVPLENPISLGGGKRQYYNLFDEVLPNRKLSYAWSGELLQGFHLFPERLGSLRAKYRYYHDDWGIKSYTYDNELSQYLTETFYMRFRFRYYQQTRAEFASNTYDGIEKYRTADIRYYPFGSYLMGLKFAGEFPDSWIDAFSICPDRWDIKGDFLLRNTRSESPQDLSPGEPFLYQFAPSGDYYNHNNIRLGIEYDL